MEEEIANNLHKSIRYVLFIAQLFGLFPMQNVLKTEIESLHFNWWSIRVLSSILTSLIAYFMAILYIIYMNIEECNQNSTDITFFYIINATSCVLLIKIAKQWPCIVKKMKEIDDSLLLYGWPKNLNRHLTIISITLLLLQAIEHLTIHIGRIVIALNRYDTVSASLDYYFVNLSYPGVFEIINFSTKFEGVIIEIIDTRMTFTWIFLDLFVVILSCYLASRFRQINERIQFLVASKVSSEIVWQFVRIDYNRLCDLCYFIDDKIDLLIFISFINNFYFVVSQSMTLYELDGTLEYIYSGFSTALLVVRTILVCWYGGWIHEETKRPLHLLSTTTDDVYNREIERFIERVRYDSVGFTGKKLFVITKHLLLKMTSSLVIFEIAAIQYHDLRVKLT